jgi:hypothetical protein
LVRSLDTCRAGAIDGAHRLPSAGNTLPLLGAPVLDVTFNFELPAGRAEVQRNIKGSGGLRRAIIKHSISVYFCGRPARWAYALMRESTMRSIIIAAAGTAALFSTSALTQQPTQGTASIPDFSGIWAHPSGPGFEPPASGPGPVTNRSRRNGVSDVYQLVGDFTNPILKPQAAEVVKKHGEISLAGYAYPTPSTHCWPSGVPFIFFQLGMQMLQQTNEITFLYLRDHEFRRVRLNQPHPAQVAPSWYGDSVGYYEGDTLVIDTVGVRTDRPLAMLDGMGRRTAKLCTLWNATGCWITRLRRKD